MDCIAIADRIRKLLDRGASMSDIADQLGLEWRHGAAWSPRLFPYPRRIARPDQVRQATWSEYYTPLVYILGRRGWRLDEDGVLHDDTLITSMPLREIHDRMAGICEMASLEAAADTLGLDWDGRCAWVPGLFVEAEHDTSIHYPDAVWPDEAARRHLARYSQREEYYWVNLVVRAYGWRATDKNDLERVAMDWRYRLLVEARQPRCVKGGKHQWWRPQSPISREWGNADEKWQREVCRRCGWCRVKEDAPEAVLVSYEEPDDWSMSWLGE